MTDPQMSADRVVRGLQELDGDALVGLVLDSTYIFDPDHTAIDVLPYEVAGGSYTRLTATGSAERIADEWKLFLDGITTADLSDSDPRSGVYWLGAAVDDEDRPTIGFADDPGAPVDPYEPTWDDGIFALPIFLLVDSLTTAVLAAITEIDGGTP